MNDALARREIDALIAEFFAAFDNRGDARPQIATVTQCFAGRAVVVRHDREAAEFYTVLEFAAPRIKLLTEGALVQFHEWEESSSTEVFGGIAARVSRYSKAGILDGKAYSGSGTKCFHLVETGMGWRISSLAWVDDGG